MSDSKWEDPTFRAYAETLSKRKVMSWEDTRALLLKYSKAHSERERARIRNQIADGHLTLVVSSVRYFVARTPNAPVMDIIQEASFGLMKAIEKFDLSHDVKFSSYAVWWIKAFARRCVEGHVHLVSGNRHDHGLQRHIPTLLQYDHSSGGKLQEFDETRFQIEPCPRVDDVVLAKERAAIVRRVCAHVHGDMERAIIKRRLLAENPETLAQIGDSFYVSRERVRQVEAVVLKKLRGLITHAFTQDAAA